MKNRQIAGVILLTITVSACQNNQTPKDPKPEAAYLEKTPETEQITAGSDYLIENKTSHSFSDPAKKDAFFIGIKGKNLLDGKVVFTITSAEGKQLLKEEFDADYLLGYDFTGDIKSQKDTDAFIKKRMQSFFSEDKFSTPAIENDVVFEDQSYYIDKETWEGIKSDKQAIGFYYLLGSEDGRHIAFSKKKGKVVMYYNCC
ncbi:hypothetical protein [Fluviicola sp.]|uniref:hypothetical protein n=1 Tax=Fluviicola sp. TaxID=1917219 RepID=UPI0031CFF9C6